MIWFIIITVFIGSNPLFTVIILFISSNSSAINPILSESEIEFIFGMKNFSLNGKVNSIERLAERMDCWGVMAAGPLRHRTPFRQFFLIDSIPSALPSLFLCCNARKETSSRPSTLYLSYLDLFLSLFWAWLNSWRVWFL